MSWHRIVSSWLSARVRLLSSAHIFSPTRGTDYTRLAQLQVYFNYPTILFISRSPPRHHHRRLLRGLLDWPRRTAAVSFTRTNPPPSI